MPKPKPRPCVWTEEESGEYWEAGCDKDGMKLFCFTEGGPEENHFQYCPYCGKPLKAKKWS